MDAFLRQALSGLALGGIYAIVALSVVMVYRATRHVNFSVGEMAMFSAFIEITLIDAGLPYWVAVAITLVVAFATGVLVEQVLVRRLQEASALSVVVVMIGLLLVFNNMAGWVFGFAVRSFPSPFSAGVFPRNSYLSGPELGAILVSLVVVVGVFVLFDYTRLGLAMRATADNLASSRLAGIRARLVLAAGWGSASLIAAVAAMMIAPMVYLEPNTMAPVLIYGFSAALLGGIDSPPGAIVGGFAVGVLENLAGAFLVGPELKLVVALVVIVGVLIVKPAGLFGERHVTRV